MLRDANFQVEVAHDGAAGLEKALRRRRFKIFWRAKNRCRFAATIPGILDAARFFPPRACR